MLTLSHLANLMALLFGDRPETMQLIARNLREEGLVATGGRGRGGARQEPQHIANMIIAACASSQVADAANAVSTFASLARLPISAPVTGRGGKSGQIVPRELAFAARSNAKFGDVLAGLVEMASGGGLYTVLMNHAADFVDRDLLRAGANAIKGAPRGKKPEVTAELAATMAAHVQTLIDQSVVYLTIGFVRPMPGAKIEFGTRSEGEATPMLAVGFGLPSDFVANPRNVPKLNAWRRMDRSHRVTITHKTLLSIGQAIAAEEGM
jgi:hypothetical protein